MSPYSTTRPRWSLTNCWTLCYSRLVFMTLNCLKIRLSLLKYISMSAANPVISNNNLHFTISHYTLTLNFFSSHQRNSDNPEIWWSESLNETRLYCATLDHQEPENFYYSEITLAAWPLISPATWLFVQQLKRKVQRCGKHFYTMTSYVQHIQYKIYKVLFCLGISFICFYVWVDPWSWFTHILQGYFTGTGAVPVK